MGDCTTTPPSHMETEGDLIDAVQKIVRALEVQTNLTLHARKMLSDLGSQLMDMIVVDDEIPIQEPGEKEDELVEIEHLLNEIQDKVMSWEKDQSMIFNSGPNEAYEYLKAVDEARKLIEILENKFPNTDTSTALLRGAHDVLQTGMSRLEEEFQHLLVHSRQSFEPEQLSFSSTDDDIIESNSLNSSGDDSVEDGVHRESSGRASGECIIELINQDVILDLKSIASLMFDSNYGCECSHAFVTVQRDALDDCLFILEVEKLSIEDVLKMGWNTLNSKIRRWIRAMKLFVRVYLTSEKLLTDKIFGGLGSVGSTCFAEASKPSILQLLNFGEAITIGPHPPEKLIRILDMYEVLAGLIPDITSLYSEEGPGLCVRTESLDVLKRLGDCARVTFIEFEKAVVSNVSVTAFSGGGVHPLTSYVMNYIKTLMDYSKTLDEVLKEDVLVEDQEEDPGTSPMSRNFRSLISILEKNLDSKSNLYKEESLQHLFLMNNVHYMAEKVKNSELRTVFGDGWIRKHNWKFQQLAMNYERATWSSMLNFLKEEGVQNSKTKAVFKERLQSFYLAFEEVYKNQTGWLIPDGQLRDDIRISASLKVIQAYRTFVGRHVNHISEKHIKYTADDLEDYLLDFFEGLQKSLHGGHKK